MIGVVQNGILWRKHFTAVMRSCTLVMLVVCIGAVTPAVSSNQPTDYLFDIWTTDNGLPQNSINAILQTKDGYLWLATFDGLVRYDGIKFVVFNIRNTPGVTSNRFTTLIEDPSEDLWIGTEDAGVLRYHDGKFSAFRAEAQMDPVIGFQIDDTGRLLIVTTQIRYRVNGGTLTSATVAPDGSDAHVPFSGRGAFAYVAGSGLVIVHNGKETVVSLPLNLIKEGISSTYIDRHGVAWVSTFGNHLLAIKGESSRQYDVSAVYS